ncbi:MAG: sulfatase, partial [bacterium]
SAVAAHACSAAAPPTRNVVLLIADDHGLDTPSYGNPRIKTPNLERLTREGVRFTNAFCTTASCSASRSVILTGLQNHANGQFGHAHSYNNFHTLGHILTLPHLLKVNGYTTGVIGKLHVNPASLYPFDVNISGSMLGSSRNGVAIAEKAKEFFQQNRNRPFYLHIGYVDPHRSREGFGNESKYPGIEETVYTPSDVRVPPYLPDTPEVQAEWAEYYQAVSRLDHGIGLILDALKATGKDKDTLVIYISDNGPAFPGAKTTLYDPGIHMPMIVRSPTQTKGGIVNNAMVSWVDLMPTILDWTGTAGPEQYTPHGRSFLPILEEQDPSGWDEVYFSHTFHEITMYYPSRGIRTRRYKYIHNLFPELTFPHASDLYASKTWQGILKRKDKRMGVRSVQDYLYRPREEIYDLERDPNEVNNVAGDAEYAQVLADLRQKTLAFRERTSDPWLILNNYADPPSE